MKIPLNKKILLLLGCIILSQAAGIIGSVSTIKNIPIWYNLLNKPFFNPPNWLFGPVWSVLYTMMGISLFLVLIKQKAIFSKPVKIFIVHLAINTIWSLVFFGLRNPGVAFIVIVILWYMIFYLIKMFYKIDKKASYPLFPYLGWVSFAGLLNLSIWYLNP